MHYCCYTIQQHQTHLSHCYVTNSNCLQEAELTWQMLEDALLKGFVPQLKAALRKQLKKQGAGISSAAVVAEGAEGGRGGDDDGGEAVDDGVENF
jgi:hypothetical protein